MKTATGVLDPIDLRILATLQRDGRLTNIKLAEAVGLSTSVAPMLTLARAINSGSIIWFEKMA